MSRQPKLTIVSGTNGTGKSTWVKTLLDKRKEKRVLVVTDYGAPEIWQDLPLIDISDKSAVTTFTGWRHTHAGRFKKNAIWRHAISNYRNGTLILDDCRPYVMDNIRNCGKLAGLLTDRRHYGLDIYFILHSIDQIPPDIYSYANWVAIGASPRVINESRLSYILGDSVVQKMVKVQQQVNRYFAEAEKRNDGSQYGKFPLIKLNG